MNIDANATTVLIRDTILNAIRGIDPNNLDIDPDPYNLASVRDATDLRNRLHNAFRDNLISFGLQSGGIVADAISHAASAGLRDLLRPSISSHIMRNAEVRGSARSLDAVRSDAIEGYRLSFIVLAVGEGSPNADYLIAGRDFFADVLQELVNDKRVHIKRIDGVEYIEIGPEPRKWWEKILDWLAGHRVVAVLTVLGVVIAIIALAYAVIQSQTEPSVPVSTPVPPQPAAPMPSAPIVVAPTPTNTPTATPTRTPRPTPTATPTATPTRTPRPTATPPIPDDHGNTASSATQMTVWLEKIGNIERPGDVDYFSFTGETGLKYKIETTLDTITDTVIVLYGRDRRTIIDDNYNISDSNYASRIEWTASADGDYYVAVKGHDGATGRYKLNITFRYR